MKDILDSPLILREIDLQLVLTERFRNRRFDWSCLSLPSEVGWFCHAIEVLSQPAGKSADNMGVSVSISGRNTVVGANAFDLPPNKWEAGGAFLFRSSF